MNKTKLISYLAIGLLLGNLLMIGFIFFKKPKPKQYEGPKKIIAERLHFDAQQLQEYEKMIPLHQESIHAQDSLIGLTKSELYQCIAVADTASKDSLENKLGQLQVEVEKIHYNHFIAIRSLCNKEQLPKFNELLKDMAMLFAQKRIEKPTR